MASFFVIRVPGWRTFILHMPESWQLFASALHWYRRKVRSRLFLEIEQGNDQAALELATRRRLTRSRGEWGETPLCAAISYERVELACELIRRGGMLANDGALASAAMRGNITVVQALLSAGKNPNEPFPDADTCGSTPLMYATNRGYFDVMRALLDAGANIDAVDDHGATAAMLARTGTPENIQALEILLRFKPDIQLKDDRGRDLIQEAVDRYRCSEKPAMFLLLKENYPDLNLDARLATSIAGARKNKV